MAAPDPQGLFVRPGVVVPERELEVQALRAGGPGGQNVNKVSSGVQLRFDVARSSALDERQRARVMQRLASRLTKSGELVLRAVEHRDQARNRDAARERLARMLAEALYMAPPRRATRPSRGSQRRRLDQKRRNSERKSGRRTGGGESD